MSRNERDEWVDAASTRDVQDLLAEELHGNHTRRGFIFGAAKLGLSTSMAAGLLAACQSGGQSSTSGTKSGAGGPGGGDFSKALTSLPLRIGDAYRPITGKKAGYVAPEYQNPFSFVQDKYFHAHADNVGWSYKAWDGARNAPLMNTIADQLIAEGYAVIFLDPQDAAVTSVSIAKAKAKGVIWCNTNNSTLEYPTWGSMLDFYENGQNAAKWILQRKPGAKVISIVGETNSSAGKGRKKGAEDAFAAGGGTVLQSSAEGGWATPVSHDLFAGMLRRFPQIDGVFGGNDGQAFGIAQAAQEAGRRNQMLIVGCDALKQGQDAVRSGLLDASIGQNQQLQCEIAAGVAEGLLRVGLDGNGVYGMYNIPNYAIDKSNVDKVWQSPL